LLWFSVRRVAMGDETDLIRTVREIAERLGKSERTAYRRLKRPEAACFELVPLSNRGGGPPAVRAGEANSFDALEALHRTEVSSLRAEAGRRGGRARRIDPNAPSLVIQCSSGSV
jgi:predicted transcriptional regulator